MIWKSFKDGDCQTLVSIQNLGGKEYICKISRDTLLKMFSLSISHLCESGDVINDFKQSDTQTKTLIKDAESFLETL